MRPLRLGILIGAATVMIAAVLGGLARLGVVPLAPTSAGFAFHGGLVVAGFFGALIGLERAVAAGRAWAYLGPIACVAGAVSLFFGAPFAVGWGLLAAGAVSLAAVNARWVRAGGRFVPHAVTIFLGAVVLVAANAWVLLGGALPYAVPAWLGFLVLTIAGERLELSRMVPVPRWARGAFGLVAGVLALSVTIFPFTPRLGTVLFGGSLIALALWLLRFDVARRTIRGRGLPRYVAACLLGGYAWLLVAGALFLAGRAGDAALHAVALGFVVAMVFGHAPVILPAVLGLSIPFHRGLYAPLVALHLTLAARVIADLAGLGELRAWGAIGNALSLALFALLAGAGNLRRQNVPVSPSPPPPGPSHGARSASPSSAGSS